MNKYLIYISNGILWLGTILILIGLSISKYNFHLLVPGAILVGISSISLKLIKKNEVNKSLSYFQDWKKELKTNGLTVEVDFNKCEIKSNNYREEIEKEYSYMSKYEAIDELTGRDTRVFNNVNNCVILFETKINGEKAIFKSPLINEQEINLKILMAEKKKTYIYVNKQNKDEYFFDLEFINNYT